MKASVGRLRRIEQRRRIVRIRKLTQRANAASCTVQQWHLLHELEREIDLDKKAP